MADPSVNNAPAAPAATAVPAAPTAPAAPNLAVSGPAVPSPAAEDAVATVPVAPAPVATPAAPQLHATKLSTLLESGKYSDLALHCDSRKWKVHKSVLCIQSEFFAKACDGEFKVSKPREGLASSMVTNGSIGGSDEHNRSVRGP